MIIDLLRCRLSPSSLFLLPSYAFQMVSSGFKMPPHDPGTPIYNLSGAIIFTAYVASALFLTALIAYNLISAYRALPLSYLSQKHGVSTINSHIQVFFALTVLSFSVLSYHMLNFLIQSYNSWAKEWGIQLPLSVFGNEGLFGREGVQLHVWQWLTGSTLFLDFAQEICGTWPRYWWTSQALWATMAVSIFMGVHGTCNSVSSFQLTQLVFSGSFCLSFLLSAFPSPISSKPPPCSVFTTSPPFMISESSPHHNERFCFFPILPSPAHQPLPPPRTNSPLSRPLSPHPAPMDLHCPGTNPTYILHPQPLLPRPPPLSSHLHPTLPFAAHKLPSFASHSLRFPPPPPPFNTLHPPLHPPHLHHPLAASRACPAATIPSHS